MKRWREECGIFGIFGHPEASRLTYLGLYALQHRGQESCGIVSLDKEQHHQHKGLGLVADNFSETQLDQLAGPTAVGHVRYSTAGGNRLANAQPLTADMADGPLALAHNGNIVNAQELKENLQTQGAIFQGTNDTEVILHLLAHEKNGSLPERLLNSLEQLVGAFSLVVLTSRELIAVRDPLGFRPLSLGKMPNGAWVVASETCAFDLIGAEFVRDVKPGEMVLISSQGLKSLFLPPATTKAQCIFEHVYFARPDSVVFGRSVYESRKNLGKRLAAQCPADADVVVPVPDSGVAAALGFSEASGIPFEMGIIRNHYVGRTFIEPKQSIRSFGVKIKLNPLPSVLVGKRVVVVDDSLVRGTTSKKIIILLRQAGAREVHLRIAAPPTIGPCYYGVDTPTQSELIASQKSQDEIREFLGADSLGYLSVDGLFSAVNTDRENFCAACFHGCYPTVIAGGAKK